MEDLRVEFKFKNAILFKKLRDYFGEKLTLKAISEEIGVGYSSLVGLLSLGYSPFVTQRKKKGWAEINGIEYTAAAMKIADFFICADPAELFPLSLYSIRFPKKYHRDLRSVEILSLQEAAAQRLLPAVEMYEDDMDLPMLQADVAESLTTLTHREETVIRLRFGIDGGNEMTLEAVAKELKINKQRIHQIEQKALRKLRHPARSLKLRSYIEIRPDPKLESLGE